MDPDTRPEPAGYRPIAKALHWLTVLAVVAQFAVGLTMSVDDAALDRQDAAVDAFEERGEEQAEREGEAGEERFEAEVERREDAVDDREDAPSGLHVALGLLVLGLGLVRLVRRRTAALPPWAPYLSAGERRLESALEKALLALLLVVPATGLLLWLTGGDLLWLHVTAQLLLLATIALHVGLVLKHTVVRRDGQLSRMV